MTSQCTFELVCELAVPPTLNTTLLQQAIDQTVANEDIPLSSLTILIVDNDESAHLHALHFNDPTPTDVMTFPDGSYDPETERMHLGDLAISADVAQQIACERIGQTPNQLDLQRVTGEEIILYVVHGLLHLLGYDDQHEDDRVEMWQQQTAILHSIGITISDDHHP